MKLTKSKLRQLVKEEVDVMGKFQSNPSVVNEGLSNLISMDGAIVLGVQAALFLSIALRLSQTTNINMGKLGRLYDRVSSWLGHKVGIGNLERIAEKLMYNNDLRKQWDKLVRRSYTPKEANAFLKKWLSPADYKYIQRLLQKDFEDFMDVPPWEKKEKLKEWEKMEKEWFDELMGIIRYQQAYFSKLNHLYHHIPDAHTWRRDSHYPRIIP